MQRVQNVIIDSSIWIEYLRGRNAHLRQAVVALIQSGRAYLCGVVLAELLAGARSASDRDRITLMFRGLPYLEDTRDTWSAAGALAANLRARGVTLPLADLLISTIALNHNCAVYTLDAHFQRVPDLPLHPS